jgi:hypothetical protein
MASNRSLEAKDKAMAMVLEDLYLAEGVYASYALSWWRLFEVNAGLVRQRHRQNSADRLTQPSARINPFRPLCPARFGRLRSDRQATQ